MQLVTRLLRCLLQIIEGALLLRSRLNHLFNELRWQVDEAARSLTARGDYIAGRRSAPGRAVHRVEPLPLFIAQRLVKPLKWRADNLNGLDGRIQSLLGGIEATNRCKRNRTRARRLDDIACSRGCRAEIVKSCFLISCRMDGLSDLINRQNGHARRYASATFDRCGIGFGERFAIRLLGLGGVTAML